MSKRKLEDEALAMAVEDGKSTSSTTYYGNISQLIAQREIEGPYYRGIYFKSHRCTSDFSSTESVPYT